LDENDSDFDKFKSSNSKNNKSHNLDEITTLENLIMIDPESYDPIKTQQNILKAAQWNQGTGSQGKWNPKFCHQAVTAYIHHLQYLLSLQNTTHPPSEQEPDSSSTDLHLPLLQRAKQTLLSSHTTERALKAMIKMNLDTHHLSKSVRNLERLIGNIGMTPLTDRLSLRLLEANGKAGNIGRTISLLNLRKVKGYKPIPKEFHYAIQSIVSAGLYLRKNRNVFLREDQQPEIDNPTRWLDAILVNMSDRGVELDTKMANQMLDCYCSTGRSGKALHFFYKITREYVEGDGKNGNVAMVVDDKGTTKENFVEVNECNGDENDIAKDVKQQMPVFENRKAKVRMKMRQHMPPYYKLPTEIKLSGDLVKRPNREELISRLKWEKVSKQASVECLSCH
jgi:pentatricopeptide repeat protein